MGWFETGGVPKDSLIGPRVQLHYGALILGSTADWLLEPAEDDSQTNLGFQPASLALETRALDARGRCFLGLAVPTMTLEVRRDGETAARCELAGRTLGDVLRWLRDRVGDVAGRRPGGPTLREYPGFPASPLAEGGDFEPPARDALTELAHWFANGRERIEALRDEYPSMSPLRVWPHHLDLGGLIPLPGGSDRMIGIGLSPGDDHYDQPYFYCSPYPNPAPEADRPGLPVGHWHTRGFVSAVATAEEIHAGRSADESAREYVAGAVSACRSLLG